MITDDVKVESDGTHCAGMKRLAGEYNKEIAREGREEGSSSEGTEA